MSVSLHLRADCLIWRTDHKNEILIVARLPKLVVLYLYIFINIVHD